MEDLVQLAELLKQRNVIDLQISFVIGRPATTGHLGEFIASKIFDIRLADSATEKGIDGYFANSSLAGYSVNVKYYPKREGLLDIYTGKLPDFFLVLTGPKSAAISSRGQSRPLVIESVFIFHSLALIETLNKRGVKIGIATSVRQHSWNEAEIFPTQQNPLLVLSNEQRGWLSFFR